MPTNFPTAVDSFPTAATLAGHNLSTDPHSTLHGNLGLAVAAIESPVLGPIWYNAKGYGAVGDGTTDDRVAIQAALTAANSAGGGIVFVPAGTYRMTVTTLASNANFRSCLVIGDNVTLVGAGRNATILKLANSQTGSTASGNSSVITNLDVQTTGNVRIHIADLTVDGNNVNQGTEVHNGITWRITGDTICERVSVKNCHGTAASGTNETGHFYAANCGTLTYRDCTAYSDAGTTGSGFHLNGSTHIEVTNCRAYAMSAAHGFTQFDCEGSVYTGCHSWLNAAGYGFNCEQSTDVTYQGCNAGGTAYNGTNKGFTAAQNLGNSIGFVAATSSARIAFVGCQARNNTSYGLIVNGSSVRVSVVGCIFSANVDGLVADNSSTGTITGCQFISNTTYGAWFNDATSAQSWSVYNCQWAGNGTDVQLPTIGGVAASGFTYAVPVPATTVALTNPFPFDATVHIVGGTVTVVSVGGTATGLIAGTVRVRATQTITLTYTVAPTWKWFLD